MKKSIYLFLLLTFLTGCSTLYRIASSNNNNLSRINKIISENEDADNDKDEVKKEKRVLTKEEVLMLMGTKTKRCGYIDFFTAVRNPYKTEILVDDKGKTYEVLYYFTNIGRSTRWEKRLISNNNLTPFVFEDGKLIGLDWGSLEGKFLKYN